MLLLWMFVIVCVEPLFHKDGVSMFVAAQCPTIPECTKCEENGQAVCGSVCPADIPLPASTTYLRVDNGTCTDWAKMGLIRAAYFPSNTNLQVLNLSNSHVDRFFGTPFTSTPNLKSLLLSNNHIRGVASAYFTSLTQLEVIDVSFNTIGAMLASAFSSVPTLKHLNLANNALAKLITGTFNGLANLIDLNLSNNSIATIDADVFHPLAKVQTININNNQLTDVPATMFANLLNLRLLEISGNKIATLADDCLSGTFLDKLDLSNNQLTNIPTKAIQQASNQPKTLDLSNNKITQVSHQDVTSLTVDTLDLSGNPLAQIVDGTFDGCTIKHIDLSNTGLTSLPASIQPWQTGGPTSLILDNPFWTGNVDILLLSRDLAKTCNPTTTYLADALTAALQQRENTCPTHTFATSTTIKTTPSRQTSTCSTGAVVVTEEIFLGLLVTTALCLM